MIKDLSGRGNVGLTLYDRFEVGDCHVWGEIDGNKILAGDDTLRCCDGECDMPNLSISLSSKTEVCNVHFATGYLGFLGFGEEHTTVSLVRLVSVTKSAS